MTDSPDPGHTDQRLATLLAGEPLSGWRGRLLRLGQVRGVVLITVVSVLASLAVTSGINLLLGDGESMTVDLIVSAIVPLIVAPLVSGAAMGLLVEVERARAALREVAVRDGLTQLYNRRYFAARLDAEIERARRQRAPLAVALVLVDIDHFKRINDTRGHATGDLVLQHVAEVLHAQVRPYDLAARFGGEEFVLLLPNSTTAEGAQVAERVRQAIEALRLPCLGDAAAPQVTVSLGVAALDTAPDGADALLRRADAALYQAKTGGRNRSIVADAPAAGGTNQAGDSGAEGFAPRDHAVAAQTGGREG